MTPARLAFDAEPASIAAVNSWLADARAAFDLPADVVLRLSLVLEELVANVAAYGGRSPCRVELSLAAVDGGVDVVLDDNGVPFDPTALPAPDVDANLADRPVGGLGIHLVRNLMDDVRYARVDGHNVLTLRKRFTP